MFDENTNGFINDDIEATDGAGIGGAGIGDGESDYFEIEKTPEINDIVGDYADEKEITNTYDQYVGAEIAIPDNHNVKIISRVMRNIRNKKYKLS